MTLDFLLNRSSAVLIIFTVAAAVAGLVTKSPAWRAAFGIAGVLGALLIAISTRSVLEWTASAVERPSPPGLLLLVVLAIATITNRQLAISAEFRFGTLMLAVAGLVLYPAAVGFLDYDSYVLGYSGYLLPAAIAVVLAYAIYRGYFIIALALNAAIFAFLFGARQSLNLWDYVVDPVAWIIATATWIAIAIKFLVVRVSAKKALAPA
jgi:MFS family permease